MVSYFSNSSLKVTRQEVLKKFSKVWAKAQQYDLRGVQCALNNFLVVWSSHCLPGKWRSMEQIKFCEGVNWTGDVASEIFRFPPGNSRFFFLLTEFTEVFLIYLLFSCFAVLFLDFQIFLISRGILFPRSSNNIYRWREINLKHFQIKMWIGVCFFRTRSPPPPQPSSW